jgi:D-xylonolactonase
MERLASGFRLVEGPTIDPDGNLVFSDVQGGGIHRLLPDGKVEEVIPHRRGVGGIAVHADGGFVISGRNVSWKRPDGETVVLLDREHEGMSFNDLTTDPDGRIYVGSLLFNPLDDGSSPRQEGDLYLIDLDGTTTAIHPGVSLTNGLGVSPDGTALYHSDTGAHAVWRYDRAADGSVSNRRPLYQHEKADPDGLAVAADGSVWIAMAGSGEVLGVAPDGSVIESISVEVPMVTSVCFGGNGLEDLYIVTGDRGAPRDVAGAIYRTKAPRPGLPVAAARVQPSR